MILKSQITGPKLKKDLNLKKGHYRWHNKNKRGGNFGINLTRNPDEEGHKFFELVGYYRTDGSIRYLQFGKLFNPGSKIGNVDNLTYDQLLSLIKNRIKTIIALEQLSQGFQ